MKGCQLIRGRQTKRHESYANAGVEHSQLPPSTVANLTQCRIHHARQLLRHHPKPFPHRLIQPFARGCTTTGDPLNS